MHADEGRGMDAKAILKAARDRISDPGEWGKGRRNYDRPMHTCCVAEAVELSPVGPERRRAFRFLYEAAGLDQGEEFGIVDWNDALERTHDDVIKALNLAIEISG
jgi:hypothetical protein